MLSLNSYKYNTAQSYPKIVISGMGPSGLSSALKLIKKGCSPILLEKRGRESSRSPQSVILPPDIMQWLQDHMEVSAYLAKERLVTWQPGQGCNVRICDLEGVMRKILDRMGFQIRYQTVIKSIDTTKEKISLFLSSGEAITDVDVIINAEGVNSSTNQLLGNHRVEVLPELLGIYSILKDDRERIKDLDTLIQGLIKTSRNAAVALYYHSLYLYLLLFKGEHFFSPSKNIIIAANVKTPGQDRVAFAMSSQESRRMLLLQEKIRSGECSKEKLMDLQKRWTRIAQCELNLIFILSKISRAFGFNVYTPAPSSYSPITDSVLVKIRPDKVEKPAMIFGKTLVLIQGDALSTVDPSTTLGCVTAIELADSISKAVESLRQKRDLDKIAQAYTSACETLSNRNHNKAIEIRNRFDPNRLLPSKL